MQHIIEDSVDSIKAKNNEMEEPMDENENENNNNIEWDPAAKADTL